MTPQLLRAAAATFALATTGCAGAPAPAGDTDMPAHPGTASGSLDGRAFDTVAAAWRIGEPDDPTRTTVVYVFDAPIACADITAAAWDETVTDATGSIEMKLIGTAKGDYPIPANGRPATGEADVNYTLTSTTGTPSEVSASAGTVSIAAIAATGPATGTFDLTFAGGAVTGSFSAAFCAAGREP